MDQYWRLAYGEEDWWDCIIGPATMYELATTPAGRERLRVYILRSRIAMVLKHISSMFGLRENLDAIREACVVVYALLAFCQDEHDLGDLSQCPRLAAATARVIRILRIPKLVVSGEQIALLLHDRILGVPVDVVIAYAQAIAEGGNPEGGHDA